MKLTIKKITLLSIGLFAMGASQYALAEQCSAAQLMEFIHQNNLSDAYTSTVAATIANTGVADPNGSDYLKDLAPEQEHIVRTILSNCATKQKNIVNKNLKLMSGQ